ncbi:Aspartate beta-hydroxylase domain-containing protein 2 [Balamuthia mandrillaris]
MYVEQSPPRLREAVQMFLAGERRSSSASPLQRPTFMYYPELSAKPWHDPEDFSFTTVLTQHWHIILQEYETLQKAGSAERIVIPSSNYGGEWSAFNLWKEGVKQEKTCALAPITTKLLEEMPEFMQQCALGYAYFSVVKSGTRITPHFGPANVKLRCHLGLKASPDCKLIVAKESRTWEAGQCLVFDDSFVHEVIHQGTEDRVVLLVDVWHPELTEPERKAVSRFLR